MIFASSFRILNIFLRCSFLGQHGLKLFQLNVVVKVIRLFQNKKEMMMSLTLTLTPVILSLRSCLPKQFASSGKVWCTFIHFNRQSWRAKIIEHGQKIFAFNEEKSVNNAIHENLRVERSQPNFCLLCALIVESISFKTADKCWLLNNVTICFFLSNHITQHHCNIFNLRHPHP